MMSIQSGEARFVTREQIQDALKFEANRNNLDGNLDANVEP